MKRLIGLLTLFILSVSINIATYAQTTEWEAWVYNSENGRMFLIGSDNVVYDDLTLPGLQNHSYSWQPIMSPDGQYIVYSLINNQTAIQIIQVYNVAIDAVIASYTIPSQQGQYIVSSLDLNATSQTFSPDSRQLAFGYTIEDRWSLLVMDIANQPGTIRLQINSDDPAMNGVMRMGFDVPTVVRFDGINIDFNIIPTGTEGAYSYPHYTYNTANNSIVENFYLTAPNGNFSDSTGMYVFSIFDYRLPNSSDTYNGFGQQVNALHVWLPGTTETFPIFNAPNRSLFRTTFIQNSERILVSSDDWVTAQQEYWVIDPNNSNPTVMTTLRNIFPSGIEGTGNGFLTTVNTNDVADVFPELQSLPNRTVLLSFDTRVAANGTSAKQVWFSEENADYKLVWARDNQQATRPTPPAWIPIGDAINATNFNSLIQNTGQSTPVTALQVGGQARIFTTDGDRANMRSGPGTNFSVVEQVANDTVVSLLEGPVSSDNFVWWRVQTATNTGWVVESADNVRVLQPFGTITPPTLPPPASSNNFQIGDRVMVTQAGNNLNARQQPSTSAPVVVILLTNQVFPVVGGPVTADGFTWWWINTAQGHAWVADGTATDTWLVNANG